MSFLILIVHGIIGTSHAITTGSITTGIGIGTLPASSSIRRHFLQGPFLGGTGASAGRGLFAGGILKPRRLRLPSQGLPSTGANGRDNGIVQGLNNALSRAAGRGLALFGYQQCDAHHEKIFVLRFVVTVGKRLQIQLYMNLAIPMRSLDGMQCQWVLVCVCL